MRDVSDADSAPTSSEPPAAGDAARGSDVLTAYPYPAKIWTPEVVAA